MNINNQHLNGRGQKTYATTLMLIAIVALTHSALINAQDSADRVDRYKVSQDFYSSKYYNQPNELEAQRMTDLPLGGINTKNLIDAIREKNVRKVTKLLQVADPNSSYIFEDSHGKTSDGSQSVTLRISRSPMSAAARSGKVGIAKILIDAGASLEYYAAGDEAPLMAAVSSGNLDMVRFLVDQGADIHKEHKGELNQEMLLFIKGLNNVPEYLDYVKKGVPLSVRPVGSGTALEASREHRHSLITQYLLSKGG